MHNELLPPPCALFLKAQSFIFKENACTSPCKKAGEKTIKKQAHTFILKEIILTKPDIHLKSKAYESKHLIVIEYVQARSNLYSAMSKHKPPPLL